jgi:hypothetical protein
MTHPIFRKDLYNDYVDTSSPQQTHTERSGEAQAATTRLLSLHHTALRRDPRGREGDWYTVPFGPHFRSSSVMVEAQGKLRPRCFTLPKP